MFLCPECGRIFDAGYYFDGVELCSVECRNAHAIEKAERVLESQRDELIVQHIEETKT